MLFTGITKYRNKLHVGILVTGLKSNEMMDPHNNLYQLPAEIGMSFYYTCLYLASVKYRYSGTVRGALTTVSIEIFEGVNILRMHS